MSKKNRTNDKPVERTVEGTETRVDEVTGRVLGPNDETVREAQPDVEPAPNGESFTENAVGREGSKDLKDDNQSGTTETVDTTDTTDTDAAVEITEGMSAEEINPGSVTSTSSVSKPNTRVSVQGESTGSTAVPQGTTVYQALVSLGVSDPGSYKVTGEDGNTLSLDTVIESDIDLTIKR